MGEGWALWENTGRLHPGIRLLERLSGVSDINTENASHSFPIELFTALSNHVVSIHNTDFLGISLSTFQFGFQDTPFQNDTSFLDKCCSIKNKIRKKKRLA